MTFQKTCNTKNVCLYVSEKLERFYGDIYNLNFTLSTCSVSAVNNAPIVSITITRKWDPYFNVIRWILIQETLNFLKMWYNNFSSKMPTGLHNLEDSDLTRMRENHAWTIYVVLCFYVPVLHEGLLLYFRFVVCLFCH